MDVRRGTYALSLGHAAGLEQGSASDSGSAEDRDAENSFLASIGCIDRLAKAIRRSARRAEAAKSTAARGIFADPKSLWTLAFCLLCRYDALFGPGLKEGGGLQAAIPSEVFDALAAVAGSTSTSG